VSEQRQEETQTDKDIETSIETEQEETPMVEEALSLEEQLEKANEQAAEYLDGWQRSRAELANFKRRVESQRAEMALMSNANLLEKLLPLLDDLQLALANDPNSDNKQNADDIDSRTWQEWRDGVALITQKFESVFNGVGVVPIETDGQDFDPNVHEAVSYEEHPEKDSGQVIAEVRKGYLLGDRVLRAAMVRVAR
jgi:molecular chaperone GrpE